MCLKVDIFLQIYPFKSKASQKSLMQFLSNRSLFYFTFFATTLHRASKCFPVYRLSSFLSSLMLRSSSLCSAEAPRDFSYWENPLKVSAGVQWVGALASAQTSCSGIANTHRTSSEERGSSLPLTSFPFVYPFYHLYLIPLTCNKRK